jgi:hypothetical protein
VSVEVERRAAYASYRVPVAPRVLSAQVGTRASLVDRVYEIAALSERAALATLAIGATPLVTAFALLR